jgi:hypothetical protein
VGRREEVRDRRHPARLNDVGDGRAGDEGDRKEDNDEHGLSEEAYHARSACPHRTVGIGGIDGGECRKEPAKREHEASAQHVAHEREEKRVAREHRNQKRDEDRRGKGNVGGGAEDPATFVGDDLVLVQEFPDVTVGLQKPGPLLGLKDLLEAVDHHFDQGRNSQDKSRLEDVVHNALSHGAAPPACGRDGLPLQGRRFGFFHGDLNWGRPSSLNPPFGLISYVPAAAAANVSTVGVISL